MASISIKGIWIHPRLSEIQWESKISEAILQQQIAVETFLVQNYGELIEEIRMGYHTLSIAFGEPFPQKVLEDMLLEIQSANLVLHALPKKVWKIPVCYGGTFGKDLDKMAATKGMSIEDIIELHSNTAYRLYFYGFLPGFMYLGGLDKRLYTDRKDSPERSVPAGSVAIGGQQTGIYPQDSPGGWHIIGRTPILLFQVEKEIPMKPSVGERVQFYPITHDEYRHLEAQVMEKEFIWSHE